MKTTTLSIALAAVVLLAAPLTSHADDGVGKLMDLSFDDAPVAKVIVAIAERSGKNIIIHPGVQGRITLKLQQVGWRAALQQVSQATGHRMEETEHGIVRILPPAPKPASAQKRAAELKRAAEVARMQVRVAELEAQRARAVAEGQTEEALRLLARLTELRANVATERVAPDYRPALIDKGSKLHIVTVYDVRDLRAELLEQVVRKFKSDGADVTFTNGQLIVKARPATQKELAGVLERARKGEAAAKRELVLDFGKPKIVRKSGTVTSKTGRYRVKLGPDGRIFYAEEVGDDADKLEKVDTFAVNGKRYKLPRIQSDLRFAAERKRIEQLTQALNHLRAAGAGDEAKRLHARIQKARTALDVAIKQRAAAERTRPGVPFLESVPLVGMRTAGDASLRNSINALRKDVSGLRQEVRELTGLVRKLLEQSGR